MSWVKEALKGLADNREVTVQPFGGSMRGRIESGQLVTIEPVVFATIQLNDVIFVKWGDNYLLHLVTAIGDGQIEIGNNLGKINGRVPEDRVLGRVVAVRDEATTVGTVVEHLNGFSFRVTLDSGTTVVARVSKSLARDMFAIRPGDRLRIGGLWNQQYRVLGFERSA